jgi:hypothetical protein
MAIYHFSMKTISRSAGRSSTAAAAYRSGKKGYPIVDRRTGEIHDYTRKTGVKSADLVLPDGCVTMSRSDLWNGVELHHKRGDAVVAREFEVALPDELSPLERRRLAVDFAREVSNHYSVAADICIHAPGKGGDQRNHHAHILLSACSINKGGFGKKVAELDPIHCQRKKIANPAEQWRERWAELANERLQESGSAESIDHRSLEAQGIDKVPTMHLGPIVCALERGRRVEQPPRSNVIQHNRFVERLNQTEDIPLAEFAEIDFIENGLLELEGEKESVTRDENATPDIREFDELYRDVNALQSTPNKVAVLLLAARLETKMLLYIDRTDLHAITRRKKRSSKDDSMLLATAIAEAVRRIINLILHALGMPQIEPYTFSQQVGDCAHRILDQDKHVLAMTKVVLYAAYVVSHQDSAAGQAWRNELALAYSRTSITEHAGLRDKSLINFCLCGLHAAGHVTDTHSLLLRHNDVERANRHKALTINSLVEINALLRASADSTNCTIGRVQAALRNSLVGAYDIDPTKLRNELLEGVKQLELGGILSNQSCLPMTPTLQPTQTSHRSKPDLM